MLKIKETTVIPGNGNMYLYTHTYMHIPGIYIYAHIYYVCKYIKYA